ncbi:MAG: hypothetical protein RR436_06990 [Clostridia bacterium]
MFDDAWGLPMTGGKCVINGEHLNSLIQQLKMNYPTEVKRAKSIIEEREKILTKAKSDAEQTIAIAKKRASEILNDQAILLEAKTQATEIMRNANDESTKVRKAAVDFVNNLLVRTEEHYDNALAVVRQAKRSVDGNKE